MSSHAIMAPTRGDARRLVEVLDGLGFHARLTIRHTKSGKRRPVVLTIAPMRSVRKACHLASFGEP